MSSYIAQVPNVKYRPHRFSRVKFIEGGRGGGLNLPLLASQDKKDISVYFGNPAFTLNRLPLIHNSLNVNSRGHTHKKENEIFLLYKEIQKGSGAKSYIVNI
jgi:hypothetical protein